MKTALVVLFALLVLAHPAAAAAVLVCMAALCGAAAWLLWKRANLLSPCSCHHRRPA